nr:hypothetical protein [uncultured Cellulosilyticum sp.]
MSNTIQLAKKYVPLLDEVYQAAAKTSVLDSDPSLAREGANTNEIIVPKISMDGLGDYDRNSGYTSGNVELTWETKKFNFERGRMFTVDTMDNEETAGIAFGRLAGEFIRTKVTPEIDAFRFACYAGKAGISKVEAGATFTKGEEVIAALRVAADKMDEDEVPEESRHLFITPTVLGMIQDMDTTKSKEVLARFASITKVPQSRFYTAIEQLDGKTVGEEKGGFKKATDAKDINFLVIEKSAVLQFPKHVVPKIIAPEANQDADAWKYGYRNYGLCDVWDNKVSGIYLHHKA